jgi:predicted AlkP superfamily pyrophosphatase or phosphodiesterase
VVKDLVNFYENKHAEIIILSEYGIGPVNEPIYLNRLFRENGLLQIREERGLELLDAGASKAFAVADHQIAHVYLNDPSVEEKIRSLLASLSGIAMVLDKKEQERYHIAHERSGDFVIVAEPNGWFTYYFWFDDKKAPDYARSVDIHKKPGYDPVEMFMTSKLRAGYKLLRKKSGLRYVMDVIPLDANLIKGSHGSPAVSPEYYPVLISDYAPESGSLIATDVYGVIWNTLMQKKR